MNYKYVTAVRHSGRTLPCDWYIGMNQLLRPTSTSSAAIWRKGMKPDEALNDMVLEAQRLDAEFFLSIDDDTQPPPQAIIALLSALENADSDVMACGGIYTTKTNPPEPLVYMGPHQGPYWKWRMGEIFPCWALGAGCLMIRMEIFKKMSYPWFKWLYNAEEVLDHPEAFPKAKPDNLPKYGGCSDDIYFFSKLANMGYKALAHGGVLPIHWSPDGKPYWLPADTIPTRGVTLDGRPFGWVDPMKDMPEFKEAACL